MKKFLSAILSMLMLLSVVSLAGCGEAETLKFGMGVYTAIAKATDADGENNGTGEADHTVAAVLVDSEGKIVKCAIDTAANTADYTSEGKAVAASEFKTKYELKEDYGMKAYGTNVTKEWYEQVDALVSVVEGKTIDEVKALVADDTKGTDEVVNAGCTITISDFILAIEKAVSNAADSSATADDTLKVGVISTQADATDATDEGDGVNEIDATFAAAAVKDGKVTAMTTDAVQVKFTFDKKGASTFDATAAVSTKKELGDNYGMKAYGTDLNGDGEVKEWYDQAAAFNTACVGKTADEISALAIDTGYGSEDLQTAGCTINVSDLVKAAVKAAK